MKDLLTGVIINDNISDELMLFSQNYNRRRHVLDRYDELSKENKVTPLTGDDKKLLRYWAERRKVYTSMIEG